MYHRKDADRERKETASRESDAEVEAELFFVDIED